MFLSLSFLNSLTSIGVKLFSIWGTLDVNSNSLRFDSNSYLLSESSFDNSEFCGILKSGKGGLCVNSFCLLVFR